MFREETTQVTAIFSLTMLMACGGKVESDRVPVAAPDASDSSNVTDTVPGPPCTGSTVQLVMPQSYVVDMTQDAERLYLRTVSDIVSVSKRDGTMTTVVPNQPTLGRYHPRGQIAVAEGTLFWTDQNGALWYRDAGGAVKLLNSDKTEAFAVLAGHIVLRQTNRLIVGRLHNGFEIEAEHLGANWDIFLGNDGVYFEENTGPQGEVTLSQMSWSGQVLPIGAPIRDGFLCYLWADASSIYYCRDTENGTELLRRTRNGLVDETVTNVECDECGYVMDRGELYLIDYSGALYYQPASEHQAIQLSQQGHYDADDHEPLLQVDDTAVYWQAASASSRPYSDDQPLPIFRTCRPRP